MGNFNKRNKKTIKFFYWITCQEWTANAGNSKTTEMFMTNSFCEETNVNNRKKLFEKNKCILHQMYCGGSGGKTILISTVTIAA